MRASFLPSSLDDKTWYADAVHTDVKTIINAIIKRFIMPPVLLGVLVIYIIRIRSDNYNGKILSIVVRGPRVFVHNQIIN